MNSIECRPRGFAPTTCFAVIVCLLQPVASSAQESTTTGFAIGLHLSGASLSVEGQERDEAGGAGMTVAYGLNRAITLFLQLDGARFDDRTTGTVAGDWTMGHADLGVRYNFADPLRRWVPYVQGAFGYRAVAVADPVVDGVRRGEVEISGSGLTLGGGIGIHVTETFALDAQILWTGGEFETLRVDDVSRSGFDIDATSGRFNLGVLWWP